MIHEEFTTESFVDDMVDEIIPQLLDDYSEELAIVILISGIDDCLVFAKRRCISEVVAKLVLGISKEYPSTFIYDKFAIGCDNNKSILRVLNRDNGVNGVSKEVIIPRGHFFSMISVSLICEVEQLIDVYRTEHNQFKIQIRTL